MQSFMDQAKWIFENYHTILSGLDVILGGLITICMVIPGPEPERTLQKVADFLSKFSRKKNE